MQLSRRRWNRTAQKFPPGIVQAFRRPRNFLIGMVALPLTAAFAVTHLYNLERSRRQALENLAVTAQLAAEVLNETLNDTFLFERLVASQSAFRRALHEGDRSTLHQLLRTALVLLPRVDHAIVTTTDGAVIAIEPEDEASDHRTLAQDPGFLKALQGGWHPAVSPVHLRDNISQEKVVEMVSPIAEDSTVIGVLQVQHRVETIKTWLQKIRIAPNGFLYVVDQDDQLVVYPLQVLPGRPKRVSDWPPVRAPLIGDHAVLRFRGGRRGEWWLAGVHTVAGTGWRVVAVQPERAVFRALHLILWPIGLLLIGLIVLVGFLGLRWVRLYALSQRVLRRNEQLRRKLRQR